MKPTWQFGHSLSGFLGRLAIAHSLEQNFALLLPPFLPTGSPHEAHSFAFFTAWCAWLHSDEQ